MNRLLRDALILALVPLVGAGIGLFAWDKTHDGTWLGLLVWTAIAFSLFEWGGLTNAPWHTISKYAQVYRWLYWAIAALTGIPLLIAALYGNVLLLILFFIADLIFQIWWRHHIFHTIIPRL